MNLSSKEGFLSKAKWIFSSLSGIISWASRLPYPMQIPKKFPLKAAAGLKTLIYSQGEPLQNPSHPSFIINSHVLPFSSPSTLPSPSISPSSTTTSSLFRSLSTHSSSWSSTMDDFIGTESGVLYMNWDHEEEMLGAMDTPKPLSNRNHGKQYQRYAMSKEYPPPIPLLTRKGILPGHIPWVLTRHCSEGKLVLIEERMKCHQYFEVYRENGRLILNLVLLDDSTTCCNTISEKYDELELEDLEFIKEEQEIEEEKLDEYQETDADDVENVEDEKTDKGSIMILASTYSRRPKTYLEDDDERYGTLRKCFTYSGGKIPYQNFLCNANTEEHRDTYSVQQAVGSASLAFPVHRMTIVM